MSDKLVIPAMLIVVVIAGIAALLLSRGKGSASGRQPGGTAEAEKQSLPVPMEQPVDRPSGPRRSEEPRHILIVDDQPAIRMLLAEVFQASGLVAHEASCGRAAIETFRNEPVDFVLLDLKMPDMDGIEALRVIRTMNGEVEAVMISACGDAERIEAARGLGVRQFFTKPFDIEKLRDYVLHQLHAHERYTEINDTE
ncbi:response regulator [uncultured Paenibacillus sp.]|uniref:response regulator n=1 Tax=uncultured Paenibacillus sp. TaxID=227322 RepID=UPI0028D556D3|nr:response regulator [uncultured Paenibacillus sp.]